MATEDEKSEPTDWEFAVSDDCEEIWLKACEAARRAGWELPNIELGED